MVIKSEELDVTNNIQDYARHADWIRSFLGIWFPGSILRGRMLLLREIQQRLSRSLSLITETIMSNVLQTLLFTYFYFFVELAFVWFIIYSLTLLQEKVLLTFTDLVRMVGVALMLFSSSLRLGCCHIQQVFFFIVYDHHENTLSHLLLIN
jgi:hypothetical protein